MPHCELCTSDKIDDLRYGKMITKQHISVHTFCLYLSSNLAQRGSEYSGIYGFLISDIIAEARRGMLLKCCYCGKRGATIGCCQKKCMSSFHLRCGIKNGALNQFVGTYKSFCNRHLPPMKKRPADDETCVICLESLMTKSGFNPTNVLHSPCCNNGWYHKYCLQHYANTSGYFFKCPLCNSSSVFRDVLLWGVYVPNSDAEWEKEPDAFRELLERDTLCIAVKCRHRDGRDGATTDLVYCTCCGSKPIHLQCFKDYKNLKPDDYICDVCNSVFKESTTATTELEQAENSSLNMTRQKSVSINLDLSDDEDDDDPLEADVFKLHTSINNSVRRPISLISSDESDSDDPLTCNWDLLKENSRNIINITSTETTKPKEQQQQQQTKKDNHQTAGSTRQPLTSCTTSTHRTGSESQQNGGVRLVADMAQEKKDEVDISCIGRRVRRRQRCTSNNQKPNDRQSGSTVHAHSWRSCTDLNTDRNSISLSDTDDANEEAALKPTKPKRRRATVNHNADISCIANRVRQRRSLVNPERNFRLATIYDEEYENSATSSSNTSPKRYDEPGRRKDRAANGTTGAATISSHNNRNNDFHSSFLRDLAQAAIDAATDNAMPHKNCPLENNQSNNLDENKSNCRDISCIGLRVHRRRTQSGQLDSEDSSSSGQSRSRKSRDN